MNIIEFNNVSKCYKRYIQSASFIKTLSELFKRKHILVGALKDVSFNICAGEKIGLLGPNGSGKTTTMKVISGILNPSRGKVCVDGHTPFKREKEYLKKISLIMGQKSHLWWDLPAMDSFLLMKNLYEIPNQLFYERLEFLVSRFNISSLLNIQVRRLSLGERMKMEIISMLLHNPKILLLDEPTIGLDFDAQNSIRNILNEYNKNFNTTMVLTSHYLNDIENLCNRVIVLNKGRLIFDGSLINLKEKYSSYLNLTIISDSLSYVRWDALGKVVSQESKKITLQIKKENILSILEDLRKIHVQEFLIEEPSIEESLKGIFEQHQVALI